MTDAEKKLLQAQHRLEEAQARNRVKERKARTRRRCGIVWRLPAAAASASQSARFPQEIPLPFRVVNKCALREKKRKAPGFSETFQRIQSCCGSFCIR